MHLQRDTVLQAEKYQMGSTASQQTDQLKDWFVENFPNNYDPVLSFIKTMHDESYCDGNKYYKIQK